MAAVQVYKSMFVSSRWRLCLHWVAAMTAGMLLMQVWQGANLPERVAQRPERPSGVGWGISGDGASTVNQASSDGKIELHQNLLARVMNDDYTKADNPFGDLVHMARSNQSIRQGLISSYLSEKNEKSIAKLASLLGSIGTKDVETVSINMVNSGDPGRRVAGLKLLGSIQDSTIETRAALRNSFQHETDAEALSIAIAATAPEPFRSPSEVSLVVQRLQQLAQNEAPSVRGAALVSLARWDAAAAAEPIVNGLRAEHNQVVEAAAFAVMESRAQTPKVREALFDVAARAELSPPLRQMAIGILAGWNLNQVDFDRLNQLRQSLGTGV